MWTVYRLGLFVYVVFIRLSKCPGRASLDSQLYSFNALRLQCFNSYIALQLQIFTALRLHIIKTGAFFIFPYGIKILLNIEEWFLTGSLRWSLWFIKPDDKIPDLFFEHLYCSGFILLFSFLTLFSLRFPDHFRWELQDQLVQQTFVSYFFPFFMPVEGRPTELVIYF